MNRSKLIGILLFLLLLLLILCTWLHMDDIAKNQAVSTSKVMTEPTAKVLKETLKSIDFHLKKDESTFELSGNLLKEDNLVKLKSALGRENVNNSIQLNSKLMEQPQVIELTQKLIPLFISKYSNGSIDYHDNKLTVEGVVQSNADKDLISTLLANSTIMSVNNTKVVHIPTEPITSTVTEVGVTEPSAEELAAKVIAEAQQKAELAKKAMEEAKAIEAEIKKVIDFENINFELNKARLTTQSMVTINKISDILKEHSNVKVHIGGHTDSSGDDTHNLNLSQSRVDSVKKALIDLGIASDRLESVGYGETKPLVSNDTKENRRINRRVEFKIIGE
ncbi:OmpA family protein [bacterium]|nr:OmpA family protein [bacterium]MBU1959097.1 OmpA family protein [bacterium]